MAKFHTKHTIHHDGEELPHGHVIELDDETAAPLLKKGHLAKADADAEVTHTHTIKPKPKAKEDNKGKTGKGA